MKIWGGALFHNSRQVRGLVVAPTKRRAVELLGRYASRYYFDNHWCETGNSKEITLLSKGEGVWIYNSLQGSFSEFPPMRIVSPQAR